jgi:DNA-binding LytR/AlgR family response regulator
MEIQTNAQRMNPGGFSLKPLTASVNYPKKTEEFKYFIQQIRLQNLDDLFEKLVMPVGKKSFLVFKNNKYINVLTKNIALFYVKNEYSIIRCFDNQEYFVNYSLEQIQNFLSGNQFYRLNRQFLVNFNAIKEVELYFARKLLVNPVIPIKEKLLVSKEKVTGFLQWMDNR